MTKSTPLNQVGNGKQVIEAISHTKLVALGEGAASCQVCGDAISKFNPAIVYIFRTVGTNTYNIGYIVCGGGKHEIPQVWTLGVQEFLMAGEIDSTQDDTTRPSKLVLLDPEVLAESAPSSKSGSEPQGGGVR